MTDSTVISTHKKTITYTTSPGVKEDDCPEPNQINPADDKCTAAIKSLIARYGKVNEDIEKPQLPIAVTHPTHLSKEDQIKANAETVDVFFPNKEDKPLPKVVTIEIKGVAGVGKTYLLQMIDDAIQANFGIVPLCAELEEESRQINLSEIPQHMMDDYRSGKIIVEMCEKTTPTFPNLQCPCCD
jgi:hypothetical protein